MTAPVWALGLMSGTSMDGIDVALIQSDGNSIERRGPGATYPYPAPLRNLIGKAVEDARQLKNASARPGCFAEAEEAITRAHGQAVKSFLAANQRWRGRVDVIGFHGQTVLHRPDRGYSVQLGDGQLLADLTGIDVVYDFRRADMAGGGQGAPLVPVYHKALAERSGLQPPLAVVNIGGVANVTWIGPQGALLAFDIGPGNALMDEWAARHLDEAMDRDGMLARRGTVDETAVAAFFTDPFFRAAPPKSLDRNYFSLFLVEGMGIWDAAATLTAITAEAVARSAEHMPQPPRHWVISGGGAHNPVLMTALRSRLTGRVDTAKAVGWSSEFMEAEAFGLLAIRSRRGLPLTFPETTGVARPACGGITAHPTAA